MSKDAVFVDCQKRPKCDTCGTELEVVVYAFDVDVMVETHCPVCLRWWATGVAYPSQTAWTEITSSRKDK